MEARGSINPILAIFVGKKYYYEKKVLLDSAIYLYYGTKSSRNLKMLILGIWELWKILTRLCTALPLDRIIFTKIVLLYFMKISYKLTAIFGMKSV